jgi:hypothetical protein
MWARVTRRSVLPDKLEAADLAHQTAMIPFATFRQGNIGAFVLVDKDKGTS